MLPLNLPARGFIVVGFPLVCQLVFATALCVLLGVVQDETQKQVQSRELISQGSKLVGDISGFFFSFSGSAETAEEIATKARAMASISAETQEVLDLAAARAPGKDKLQSVAESANKMLALFTEWTQEQSLGSRNADAMRPYFNLKAIERSKGFIHEMWSVILDEESNYLQNASQQRLAVARIHSLFLLAGCASVIGALMLGWVYALLISGPIKRLTENSRLLSQRKLLLPPLNSGDEFAVLDNTFREVAKSLAEASASERAMIDNAEDLICSLSQDGIFKSLNPYAEVMLAYQPHALVGQRLTDLIVGQDRELAEHELQAARASNQQRSFAIRLQRRDGLVIDTLWSCFWSASEDSLFCVVNDNSEAKRIERLKHDFMAVITEDLQAPLSAMKDSMDKICSGAQGPISEITRKRLQGMIGSIDSLVLLANDLLDTQKLSSGHMQLQLEPLRLATIIAEATEMVRGLAEAKRVQLLVVPGDCQVIGDKQKLTEVLVNLLGNAIKYTPDGTSVTVRDEVKENTIEVSVHDCGPGVPEAYRERIFNAFEQAPDAQTAGHGVGLGLAICKMIVQAHGGAIGVTVGAQGSTFWFRLALTGK
jgi:PAS domain S-box-containing protein